jgi:hypothetical protein
MTANDDTPSTGKEPAESIDQQSEFDSLHGVLLADEGGEVEIAVSTCPGQSDEEKRSDETVAVRVSLINEETDNPLLSFACSCTPARARKIAGSLDTAAGKMEG